MADLLDKRNPITIIQCICRIFIRFLKKRMRQNIYAKCSFLHTRISFNLFVVVVLVFGKINVQKCVIKMKCHAYFFFLHFHQFFDTQSQYSLVWLQLLFEFDDFRENVLLFECAHIQSKMISRFIFISTKQKMRWNSQWI